MKVKALVSSVLRIAMEDKLEFQLVSKFMFCYFDGESSKKLAEYRTGLSNSLNEMLDRVVELDLLYPHECELKDVESIIEELVGKQDGSYSVLDKLTGKVYQPDQEHYLNPHGCKSKFMFLRNDMVPTLVIGLTGFVVLLVGEIYGSGEVIGFGHFPVLFFLMFFVALLYYYPNSGGVRMGVTEFSEILAGETEISNRLRCTLYAFMLTNDKISNSDLERIYCSIRHELKFIRLRLDELRSDFPIDVSEEKCMLNAISAKMMLDLHYIEDLRCKNMDN